MTRLQVLLLGVFLLCTHVSAQVTSIKAGRLIDPDSGTVIADQIIVVRANKIERMAVSTKVPVPRPENDPLIKKTYRSDHNNQFDLKQPWHAQFFSTQLISCRTL